MKIEAIDTSEMEIVEFNESEGETISFETETFDANEAGPSSSMMPQGGGTVALNSPSKYYNHILKYPCIRLIFSTKNLLLS